MSKKRRGGIIVSLLLCVVLIAAPAFAHVTANPEEVTSGYTALTFRVPHGCDEGAATETLRVSIPAGVASVKPELVHGWDVDTDVGELDEPVQLHGEEVTEGVREITWTGGPAIPDDVYKDFGVSMYVAADPGDTLYFPAVQECVDGSETAWIQIPADGQDREELDEPAPAVTVTEADEERVDEDRAEAAAGGGDGTEEEAAGMGNGRELTAAEAGTDTAAVVALGLAVVAVVLAAAAFLRAGRRAA